MLDVEPARANLDRTKIDGQAKGADGATFAVELYLARAFEDEIKLLRHLVIMPLCPAACGDARFRVRARDTEHNRRRISRPNRPELTQGL
jgi:hypothetical protein